MCAVEAKTYDCNIKQTIPNIPNSITAETYYIKRRKYFAFPRIKDSGHFLPPPSLSLTLFIVRMLHHEASMHVYKIILCIKNVCTYSYTHTHTHIYIYCVSLNCERESIQAIERAIIQYCCTLSTYLPLICGHTFLINIIKLKSQ